MADGTLLVSADAATTFHAANLDHPWSPADWSRPLYRYLIRKGQ